MPRKTPKDIFTGIAIWALLLIIAGSLIRIAVEFKRTGFIDFAAYYDVSLALVKGLNPSIKANLISREWGDVPVVFPGYFCIYAPMIIFNIKCAGLINLAFNIAIGLFGFFLIFRKCGMFLWKSIRNFDLRTLILGFWVIAFLNSTYFLAALRHGQAAILIGFCFILLLIYNNKYLQPLLLAVIAVLKYSILVVFAPAMFIKKHYATCLIGFVLFIVAGLIPGMFGSNIVEIYRGYIAEVVHQGYGNLGFNTFQVSGYNMLQLDCFQSSILGWILKVLFMIPAIWALIRERKTKRFGINFLFMIFCITMLLSYNRVYNLVIFMPLLYIIGQMAFVSGKKLVFVASFAFSLFFMIPESILFRFCNYIGHFSWLESVFIMSKFETDTHIFPLLPLVMASMALFAILNYFLIPEPLYFLDNTPENPDECK
jgi:hypothetical protein